LFVAFLKKRPASDAVCTPVTERINSHGRAIIPNLWENSPDEMCRTEKTLETKINKKKE
jgi:hypothetical protein